MEAKGCAKPAVWKDARRHFYWAVRGRVARSSALAQLAEANPESTFEYRSRLLNSIAFVDKTTDPRIAAETLEKLDLTPTVAQPGELLSDAPLVGRSPSRSQGHDE